MEYVDIELMKREWEKQAPATYALIKDDIDKFPTVDAVQVVRCKDCKYFKKSPRLYGDPPSFWRRNTG